MWDGGYKAMESIIKRKPKNYVSIFSTCDMLGVGVKKISRRNENDSEKKITL